MRGVTIQALLPGKCRIMAHCALKILFSLIVAIPAKVGDLFNELPRPLRPMAGSAHPRSIGAMLKGVHGALGSAMRIVTARAVGLCHVETAVFGLQSQSIVTSPAQIRDGHFKQPLVVRAVRVMARAAFPLRNRSMQGFSCQTFFECRVTPGTEILLRLFQQALVL